jgi:hypothetical protein
MSSPFQSHPQHLSAPNNMYSSLSLLLILSLQLRRSPRFFLEFLAVNTPLILPHRIPNHELSSILTRADAPLCRALRICVCQSLRECSEGLADGPGSSEMRELLATEVIVVIGTALPMGQLRKKAIMPGGCLRKYDLRFGLKHDLQSTVRQE